MSDSTFWCFLTVFVYIKSVWLCTYLSADMTWLVSSLIDHIPLAASNTGCTVPLSTSSKMVEVSGFRKKSASLSLHLSFRNTSAEFVKPRRLLRNLKVKSYIEFPWVLFGNFCFDSMILQCHGDYRYVKCHQWFRGKIYSVCHAESWAIYIIILCGLSMSTVHCFEYLNIIIKM